MFSQVEKQGQVDSSCGGQLKFSPKGDFSFQKAVFDWFSPLWSECQMRSSKDQALPFLCRNSAVLGEQVCYFACTATALAKISGITQIFLPFLYRLIPTVNCFMLQLCIDLWCPGDARICPGAWQCHAQLQGCSACVPGVFSMLKAFRRSEWFKVLA